MKNIILLFLAICLSDIASSQKQVNEMNVADSVVKAFTWDIQKEAKGTLMFLDVTYKREGQDSSEDMTLTVAKDKMHKRPAFISIIIPNNVDQARGIFIKFSKTFKDTSGKRSIEMEKSDPVRIPFEKCDNEKKICTARISGGYVVDAETDEKHD
ncbi:MAG TPA: hypothetical protein VK808_04865, partial [Bacteroidia bacterium]|nr:hypothetical protein [Bacteroidia bacterium]